VPHVTGPAVVPRPLRLQQLSDQPFVLVPGIAVVAPDPAAREAAERLATLVGGSVRATAAPDAAAFRLRLLGPADDERYPPTDPAGGEEALPTLPTGESDEELPAGAEAYRLHVHADGVDVDARTPAGLGHASC